jgi:hypothetical protein
MKAQATDFTVISTKEYSLNENKSMIVSIIREGDRLHELKTIVQFMYDKISGHLGRRTEFYRDGILVSKEDIN